MSGRSKRNRGRSTQKKKTVKKPGDFQSQHAHLFKKAPRDYRIGRDIMHKNDLSRYVKWPRYIRLQRQRAILKKRLKIPPAIHQFSKTLEKQQASNLFRLLSAYRPETDKDKKERLLKAATKEAKGQEQSAGSKPVTLKYGLNHITELVETKKAKLVVIAHDVDPIELVVWLPALCRKMDVPYCIVKGKARLGHMVHKKTATAVALTSVRREDNGRLEQLVSNFRLSFNNSTENNKWGDGELGIKSKHREIKEARQRKRDAARSQI